jgi:hypothetical protein
MRSQYFGGGGTGEVFTRVFAPSAMTIAPTTPPIGVRVQPAVSVRCWKVFAEPYLT